MLEAGDAAAAVGDGLLHRALEDGDQQVVLAAEVQVHGSGGDAGGPGDVGDLGVEEAAGGEGVDGGPEDRVAFVAAIESRRRRNGSGGRRALDMNEWSFSDRWVSTAIRKPLRFPARPPTRAGWSVVLIHSGKHRVREGRRGELPGSTIAQGAADRPDGRRVHGVRRAATRARGGVAPRRVWNGPEGRDDVG